MAQVQLLKYCYMPFDSICSPPMLLDLNFAQSPLSFNSSYGPASRSCEGWQRGRQTGRRTDHPIAGHAPLEVFLCLYWSGKRSGAAGLVFYLPFTWLLLHTGFESSTNNASADVSIYEQPRRHKGMISEMHIVPLLYRICFKIVHSFGKPQPAVIGWVLFLDVILGLFDGWESLMCVCV